MLSTNSRSGRENRSGLLGVRDVPGVVEDSRLPGSGRPLGPCAPPGSPAPDRHDGRRARRPPKLAWLRSAFLQAWNDGPVVIVFIRSSDKYTLPLRLQAFSNKTEPTGTGDGGRRALA